MSKKTMLNYSAKVQDSYGTLLDQHNAEASELEDITLDCDFSEFMQCCLDDELGIKLTREKASKLEALFADDLVESFVFDLDGSHFLHLDKCFSLAS